MESRRIKKSQMDHFARMLRENERSSSTIENYVRLISGSLGRRGGGNAGVNEMGTGWCC